MKTLKNQRGAVLPLVTISMVILIAIAGLVTDLGHLYIEKTRLQNTLDGAALRGAYVLNITDDEDQARSATLDTINRSLNAIGSGELKSLVNVGNVNITFPIINSPAGTTKLIKVAFFGLTIDSTFTRVLGQDTLDTGAIAVAGAVPLGKEICNVVPIIVCGSESTTSFYGYNMGQVISLKVGSWSAGDIGPGNFHLLDLNGTGGANLRENLAGGGVCVNQDQAQTIDVNTKTGNTVGPTGQGINTRLGEYSGPINGTETQYPADWVTTSPMTYSDYKTAYSHINVNDPPAGAPNRRIVTVPIGNCGEARNNGDSDINVIAFGCFFLKQKSNGRELIGEFVGGCEASGIPGNGTFGTGPYKIVLYRDLNSPDS